MKRILTVAVITSTLLLSIPALHADNNVPRMHYHTPEEVVEQMADRLDLTEEQKSNIIVIKKDEVEKIRALRQENRAKIASYLTDEQKQKQLEQYKNYKNSKHAKDKKCTDKINKDN